MYVPIMERELSALSTLSYKRSVFFIAFIYYICKIYLSNDKSLFWALSLRESPLAGYWEEICRIWLFVKLQGVLGEPTVRICCGWAGYGLCLELLHQVRDKCTSSIAFVINQ